MKNVPLSPEFRTSFAVLFLCLSVILASLMVGASIAGSQTSSSKKQDFTENLPGGVKLEMAAIPGGSFMMGSKRFPGESEPIHSVTLKPFYIGKYEVTQAQWIAVMDNNNPSGFKGDSLPVENVLWNVAKEFCEKLSKITGKEYRLPSEAEWEYAARAGSIGDYCFGDDESKVGEYAWYKENSGNKTHPVGQKKPNSWGLYDVHGNVFEWCEDVYHENYKGAPTDGSAWVTGNDTFRHLRGGAWDTHRDFVRAGYRFNGGPLMMYSPNYHGIRVVGILRPPSK